MRETLDGGGKEVTRFFGKIFCVKRTWGEGRRRRVKWVRKDLVLRGKGESFSSEVGGPTHSVVGGMLSECGRGELRRGYAVVLSWCVGR